MTTRLHPAWLDWPEVQTLLKAFASQKAELRFVGGAVRDAVLGRAAQDVDAATPLPPEDVMALLRHAEIKAVPTGIDHGTVTAMVKDKAFEITTLRRDTETFGRRAKVEYTDNWKEDAARRDFTMNALYLSAGGELFDYFGGVDDAKAGRVRFIGKAAARIQEDYLRILRFFRFYTHYGKGELDVEALKACKASASHLMELSGERIQQEMLKLLLSPTSYPTVKLMYQSHILEYVLGIGIDDLSPLERLERQSPSTDPIKKLVMLLKTTPHPLTACDVVARRLKLSNSNIRRLNRLLEESSFIDPQLSLPDQKKTLRRLGSEWFADAVFVSAAETGEWEPYQRMLALPETWEIPVFPVSGDDLKAHGIAEGKSLGQTLQKLEDAWEASDYTLTKEKLLATLK